MELWLDALDEAIIKQADACGLLHGVTTNPSIIARSERPLEDVLSTLLELQKGPVTVQVTASKAEDMIAQAKTFWSFSPRLIIKIPASKEGFCAMAHLKTVNIPVMATMVFDVRQALLSAKLGALYIAPYFSHLLDAGKNAEAILSLMQQMLTKYHFPTKLLAASLRTMQQMESCISIGCSAVTVKESLFTELLSENPLTLQQQARFEKENQMAKLSQLLQTSAFTTHS